MSGRKSRTNLRQISLADPISILDIILEYVLDNRWKDYKRFSQTLANRIIERRPAKSEDVHKIIEAMRHPFFAFNEIERKDFEEHFPSKELILQSRRARTATVTSPSKATSRRKGIGKRLRYLILERDHFRCKLCGKTAKQTKLEIDHIIPVAKGGGDSLTNLQTLCIDCNRGKSDLKT